MNRVLTNYLKWKFPQLRSINITSFEREFEQMRIVFTHKTGGIFSKKRDRKIIKVTLWDMVEYLYFSASGKVH